MATLAPQDRLQPALLDRLMDDAPAVGQESREARLITGRKLRSAVLRDLAWLFNATRVLDDRMKEEGATHAARSVLNYGLPALSGTTASSLDVVDLEGRIRQAILDSSRAFFRRRSRSARRRPIWRWITTIRFRSRSAGTSGRSPSRWNCCCGPKSISRAASSRFRT
jgi:hypothetical protein